MACWVLELRGLVRSTQPSCSAACCISAHFTTTFPVVRIWTSNFHFSRIFSKSLLYVIWIGLWVGAKVLLNIKSVSAKPIYPMYDVRRTGKKKPSNSLEFEIKRRAKRDSMPPPPSRGWLSGYCNIDGKTRFWVYRIPGTENSKTILSHIASPMFDWIGYVRFKALQIYVQT